MIHYKTQEMLKRYIDSRDWYDEELHHAELNKTRYIFRAYMQDWTPDNCFKVTVSKPYSRIIAQIFTD